MLKNSISTRFTRHFLTSAAIALTIVTLLIFGYAKVLQQNKRTTTLEHLQSFANSISPALTHDLVARNFSAARIRGEFISFKERANGLCLTIFDAETNLVFSTEEVPLAVDDQKTVTYRAPLDYFGTHYGTLEVGVAAPTLWQVILSSNLIWVFFAIVAVVLILLLVLKRIIRKEVELPLQSILTRLETPGSSDPAVSSSSVREWKILSQAILRYREQIIVNEKIQAELTHEKAITEFAAQVAHDIRSPLSALQVIVGGLDQGEEKYRDLIRSAAGRIQQIANTLLAKNLPATAQGEAGSTHSPQLVLPLFIESIEEKRLETYAKAKIHLVSHINAESTVTGFSVLDPYEFRRIFSNLLNNAVEAIEAGGKLGTIRVNFSESSENIKIEIQDDGPGIPPEILPRLGTERVTVGKPAGSGLGLFHAKKTLKGWNADLKINSASDRGTFVELIFPKADPPIWNLNSLDLKKNHEVIVVDDDNSIHGLWKERFSDLVNSRKITLRSFFCLEEFSDFLKKASSIRPKLFLIDNNFTGSLVTGLEFILKMKPNSAEVVLVTGSASSQEITTICEARKVKYLPKSLVSRIPIILA